MTTRLSRRVVRRTQLPLTERDVRDLHALRSHSPMREALVRLLPEEQLDDVSEGALLHALLGLAMERVREEAEADGYAELARERDNEAQRRVARRRRPSWADEA